MSQRNPFGNSESDSSDSEDGGVLLTEHSPPPPTHQSSNNKKQVTAWLSTVTPTSQPPAPPTLSPSPAPKQIKTVRFTYAKSKNRSPPPPAPQSRSSPYAISFPPSSNSTTTIKSPTNTSLPTHQINLISSLLNTDYVNTCPFITAAACPLGPKCTLKVMKPSAITLCLVYLKVKGGGKRECEKQNNREQHKKAFLHEGDEGFREQVALRDLRGVHEDGVWGVVGARVGVDGKERKSEGIGRR